MKQIRLAVFLLFLYVSISLLIGANEVFAALVFDQSPLNEDYNGAILNTSHFVSFGCTAGLNCHVPADRTVYNVGVWIKKVGNPSDIRLQLTNTWKDSTGGTNTFSNSLSASSISDTDYMLKWFYFPSGVVIGNQGTSNQFFQFQFSNANGTFNPTDYYKVLQHSSNDFSAPQQWCKTGTGCFSSIFFWKMDDRNVDLNTYVPPVQTPPVDVMTALSVTISPSGVISPFSIYCTGTNATVLLVNTANPGYSLGGYMRRPCIDNLVTFESFDVSAHIANVFGPYPQWTGFIHLSLELVVKNSTTLYSPDPPFYETLVNLYSASNNFNHATMLPSDDTYPTLGAGSTFNFDGNVWSDAFLSSVYSDKPAVLFLPGLEASRLYRQTILNCQINCEDQLWEPNANSDVEALFLDENGKSLDDSIYTRDVIDEAYAPVVGPNIYKSFLAKLEEMKSTNHAISDYSVVPYDWRLSLDDVLSGGTRNGANISYILSTSSPFFITEELRRLANSTTGKITIVAHSNGGLVAKTLLKYLADSNDPLLSRVDKLILVAVPQIGTPSAIAGLLHGYDQGIPFSLYGFFMSNQTARQLGQNMSSAYNFLPDQNYFTYVDTPVVTFDPSLTDWISRYASVDDRTIHDQDRLRNFLTDTYSRVASTSSDTNTPVSLRDNLFTQSQSVHQSLDNWTPPAGIEVTEIAGWGIPKTVSGMRYKKGKPTCAPWICALLPDIVKSEPTFTIDGDGTVVTPSALWANGANVNRYWVDLDAHNIFLIRHADHKDILEVSDLISSIKNIVIGTGVVLSDYILDHRPISSHPKRLIYALHSPLTLDIYDNLGHHTGISTSTNLVEEQIPGTYFTQFGDIKYIFTDTDTSTHIFMNGYADGTFTFNIDELQGDTPVASTTFKDIPTTSNTKVSLDVQSDINTVSPMRIDENGDGADDWNLKPKLNGIVTIPRPLTITALNQNIILGDSIPTFTYNITGFVNGDTATSSDVTGTASCSTTATSASPVGSYSITCTVGTLFSDNYTFSTFIPATLKIIYRFDGFLQPINDTSHQIGQSLSVFKAGSTVPVKLQLKRADGTIVQANTLPTWLPPQKGSSMSVPVDESVYTDPGTTGSAFKWDSTSQQYQYNWNTKGFASGYWYKIFVQLNDGTTQSVTIGLK